MFNSCLSECDCRRRQGKIQRPVRLSKILSAYKVKLSSQQSLDVLSRLRFNLPYEALLSKPQFSASEVPLTGESEGSALYEWLDCATSFRELFKTLSREGVDWADWGNAASDSARGDGEVYLRACGAAAERFSRIAETLIQRGEAFQFPGLTFSAVAGDLILDGALATLRIQSHAHAGRVHLRGAHFVPLGLNQRVAEPVLFGSESRIVLRPALPLPGLEIHPGQPSVDLTYEVAGQQPLAVFADILQMSDIQRVWDAVGEFDVESSITLTKDGIQDIIEEHWTTDDDPDGKRLQSFCLRASRLSDEETCDWPPFFRLTCALDSTSTQDELERFFLAICAYASCMIGDRGGSE